MEKSVIEKIIEIKNHPEFIEIKREFAKKTIFSIVKIRDKENAHSDFLAWLFDADETHSLQKEPLIKLLDLLLLVDKDNKAAQNLLSLIKKENGAKISVEREHPVLCENKKRLIDIFFSVEYGGEKYSVIIENKLLSRESKEQTEDLANANDFANDKNTLYVFLRLPGEPEAKSKKFINIDYGQLCKNVIDPLAKSYGISGGAKLILEDYIATLSIPTADDDSFIGFPQSRFKKGGLLKKLDELLKSFAKDENGAEKDPEKKYFEDFLSEHKSVIRAFIRGEKQAGIKKPQAYKDIEEFFGGTASARIIAQGAFFALIGKVLEQDPNEIADIIKKFSKTDKSINNYSVLCKSPEEEGLGARYIRKTLEEDLRQYFADSSKMELLCDLASYHFSNDWYRNKKLNNFCELCSNYSEPKTKAPAKRRRSLRARRV